MPVVMTGSPGGSMGGNGGSTFGSGLSGLSASPKKLFSPSLEVWLKRGEEDKAMAKERRKEYDQMRNDRLEMVSAQQSKAAAKRAKDQEEFAKRQADLKASQMTEKKRDQQYRMEALKQPTLGSPEPPWAHLAEKCGKNVGTRPEKWNWFAAKAHPEMDIVGRGAKHNAAMRVLPSNATAELLEKYTDNIASTAKAIYDSTVAMTKMRDAELAELAEKEKREREEAVKAMRNEQLQKKEAAAKAEAARKRQIKREMAEETAKVCHSCWQHSPFLIAATCLHSDARQSHGQSNAHAALPACLAQ